MIEEVFIGSVISMLMRNWKLESVRVRAIVASAATLNNEQVDIGEGEGMDGMPLDLEVGGSHLLENGSFWRYYLRF
jgi:hypothetical protein